MAHRWGGPFPYFVEVAQAADEIGKFCRKWGRINVTQMKEKYGISCVYCNFGAYQLFSLTHPGYVYSRYPKWLWSIDIMYISKLFQVCRINDIIVPYQLFIYRLAYKRALKKYPMIKKEILSGADYPEYLKDLK